MITVAIVSWSSLLSVSTLCDVRKLRVIGSCMWQDRINYIAAMFGQLLFYADARYDHIILSSTLLTPIVECLVEFYSDSLDSLPVNIEKGGWLLLMSQSKR